MHGFPNGKSPVVLAWGVAFFFLVAGQAYALSRPTLAAPTSGATVSSLPAFAWAAAAGADRYQFEVATDAGFNSPIRVDGHDYLTTRNTRATLKKAVPNGKLYWHVRSVNASGATSAWSAARSLTKAWLVAPILLSPTSGASLSFPSEPLELAWSAVPRSAHYRVTLATDPTLGSALVEDEITAATAYTPDGLLPRGAYYWAVTPIDGQGNRGKRSAVGSFTYSWPSTVTPSIADLLPAVNEVFDPQFSWGLVPGAARYEVEVNPSSDFAAGSKVCCDKPALGSAHSPTTLFQNNVYYWRVRALDAAGNAGVWAEGTPFQKTFDSPPDTALPTVKNLRMRDNLADPGADLDLGVAGYQTDVPIVTWDPVPGAASYLVEVAPFGVSNCNWSSPTSHWLDKTATTSWTPLGTSWNSVEPYQASGTVSSDSAKLVSGDRYCVRVRARSDRTAKSVEIMGLETVLDDASGFAFEFTGAYPTVKTCWPGDPAYPASADYLEPVRGTVQGSAPLFTWNAIPNAWSYFVLVARDESFTNVVDYAFVREPAYAPRKGATPTTYTDELTSYYWAVLPAACTDGDRAQGTPSLAVYADFQKRSTPPTLLSPIGGAQVSQQPIFRWMPTLGARSYRLQVAQDSSFANPIDTVLTNATSYVSDKTYDADTVLYWRVRAEDENKVGLTWSSNGTFRRVLGRPVPSATNPTAGSMIPAFTWAPVTGAVSYDVQVDLPDGTTRTFKDFRSTSFAAVRMTGVGIFGWRVRATFPTMSTSVITTPGPWSATKTFTRTIPEPTGTSVAAAAGRVVLGWRPRLGAERYRLEVASSNDFSSLVETVTTDETIYAPALMLTSYRNGGTLYWRVAAVDEDGNVGAYSQTRTFAQPRAMSVSTDRYPTRLTRTWLTIRVLNAARKPVRYAAVRGYGAGVSTVTKRTRADGTVRFSVRPTRRGTLTFRASKSGYRTASVALPVR